MNQQTQSPQGFKIERPKRNDLIYAVIMILLLVLGFIGGTLVQLGHSASQCNDFYQEWIDHNCECSEQIRDNKANLNSFGMNITEEVPPYAES